MKEILTKEEKKLRRKERWSEFKNTCKKINENRKKIGILAIITVIVVIALYIWLFVYNSEPTITTEQLNIMISESSELTAAKLNGKGYSMYEDDGIPIINSSDFLMIYDYTVRAGFEIKDVEVDVNNLTKTVTVEIPKSKILDAKVDSKSMKFYDEDFALFNVDEKEDLQRALTAAEVAVYKDSAESGILEYADKHSTVLIKGIIGNVIPEDYSLNFILVEKK